MKAYDILTHGRQNARRGSYTTLGPLRLCAFAPLRLLRVVVALWSPARQRAGALIGDWRLEIGDWRLEIGDWRLEIIDQEEPSSNKIPIPFNLITFN
jgi:hypothetical protein